MLFSPRVFFSSCPFCLLWILQTLICSPTLLLLPSSFPSALSRSSQREILAPFHGRSSLLTLISQDAWSQIQPLFAFPFSFFIVFSLSLSSSHLMCSCHWISLSTVIPLPALPPKSPSSFSLTASLSYRIHPHSHLFEISNLLLSLHPLTVSLIPDPFSPFAWTIFFFAFFFTQALTSGGKMASKSEKLHKLHDNITWEVIFCSPSLFFLGPLLLPLSSLLFLISQTGESLSPFIPAVQTKSLLALHYIIKWSAGLGSAHETETSRMCVCTAVWTWLACKCVAFTSSLCLCLFLSPSKIFLSLSLFYGFWYFTLLAFQVQNSSPSPISRRRNLLSPVSLFSYSLPLSAFASLLPPIWPDFTRDYDSYFIHLSHAGCQTAHSLLSASLQENGDEREVRRDNWFLLTIPHWSQAQVPCLCACWITVRMDAELIASHSITAAESAGFRYPPFSLQKCTASWIVQSLTVPPEIAGSCWLPSDPSLYACCKSKVEIMMLPVKCFHALRISQKGICTLCFFLLRPELEMKSMKPIFEDY